ncbi:hypothetical protein [Legionella impletisoli]|nr:hypothetical protein [Legionella impletisoli]
MLSGLTFIVFSQSIFFSNVWVLLLSSFPTLFVLAIYKAQGLEENIKQIEYNKTGWIIRTSKTKVQKFEHLELSFDSSFFSIFTLTNAYTKKKLILFHDQLTKSELQRIRIILKVDGLAKVSG